MKVYVFLVNSSFTSDTDLTVFATKEQALRALELTKQEHDADFIVDTFTDGFVFEDYNGALTEFSVYETRIV